MRCLLAVALALLLLLARAEARVFTVDPQDDSVYRYDDGGVLEATFALVAANQHAQGIAFSDGNLLVLDRRDRRVYRYAADGAFIAPSRELRQARGGGLTTTIAGVAVADDDLWVVDRGRAKVLRYSLEAAFDPEVGQPLLAAQEIALVPTNARAEGVAVDASHLFVLDHVDRRVYRYRRDGDGPVDVSRVLKEVDGDGTRAPYGIARSGDFALVVDASRDTVYRYDVAELFGDSSDPLAAASQFRLAAADDSARDLATEVPAATTTTTTPPDESTTTTTTPDGGTSSTLATTSTSSVTTGTGATTSTTATTPPPAEIPAFFTIDAQDGRVYRYDDAGTLTGGFALENAHPQGLSVEGDRRRVLDSGDRRLHEYDDTGTLVAVSRELVQASGRAFGTTGGGVALDGDELWVVHRGEGKLARYSLADAFTDDGPLAAAEEIALDPVNAHAEGLALDETYLYVLDQDRLLYRYERGGTGPVVASAVMTGTAGSLGAPYGVALADGVILVVDASRNAVFGYHLAALFAGDPQVAAAVATPLDAANDDPRDIALVP